MKINVASRRGQLFRHSCWSTYLLSPKKPPPPFIVIAAPPVTKTDCILCFLLLFCFNPDLCFNLGHSLNGEVSPELMNKRIYDNQQWLRLYHRKLTIVNSTVIVTGIFQFSKVNFTLVNFHYYGRKKGGYFSSLFKLCSFCWQLVAIAEENGLKNSHVLTQSRS